MNTFTENRFVLIFLRHDPMPIFFSTMPMDLETLKAVPNLVKWVIPLFILHLILQFLSSRDYLISTSNAKPLAQFTLLWIEGGYFVSGLLISQGVLPFLRRLMVP